MADGLRPAQDLLDAWERLDEVLGQIREAELETAEQVDSLAGAVMTAATQHGIEIELEAEDEP